MPPDDVLPTSPAPAAPAAAAPPAAPPPPVASPLQAAAALMREQAAAGRLPSSETAGVLPGELGAAAAPTGEPEGPSTAEGADTPPGEAGAAGEDTPPAAEAAAAEPVEGVVADPSQLVILPGRRPGTELELVVEDPVIREHLTMLAKGFMRAGEAQEIRAEAETRISAAEDVVVTAQVDPVGFLGRANAPTRAMVVRNLLLDPAVFQEVQADLQDALQHGAATIEDRAVRERLEYKEKAQGDAATYRARQKFVGQLDRVLTESIGAAPGLDDGQRDAIYGQLIDLTEAHETRTGKPFLKLGDALTVLAPHARVHNISFDRTAPSAPPTPPASPAPPAPAVPPKKAPAPTVATLQANAAKKAGLAATASTGRAAPEIPSTAPVRAATGGLLKDATKALRASVRRPT